MAAGDSVINNPAKTEVARMTERRRTVRILAVCVCWLVSWSVFGQEREVDRARRYVGEPISLSLKEADLVETLRNFAQIGKFNLILDPSISGTVTVELKNVPWDQALEQILKVHGLGLEISGAEVLIAPPQDIERLLEQRRRRLDAVRTVRLNLVHARATAVAACFNGADADILTADGAAEAQEDTKTLILRDRAARLLKIGSLLVLLDLPEAAEEPEDEFIARCRGQWSD